MLITVMHLDLYVNTGLGKCTFAHYQHSKAFKLHLNDKPGLGKCTLT